MEDMEVTLATIAKTLGISPSSVSRALAGKTGVSEETKQKVFEVAKKLGYRGINAKPAPRSPRALRNNILLFIPPDSEYAAEFWFQVISGADSEAERLGYNLITRPIEPDMVLTPETLLSRDVQGAIALGHLARPLANSCSQFDLPISLISHPRPADKIDTITTANWEGGFMVGQYLVDLGHRRVAYLAPNEIAPSYPERLRGFRDAMHLHSETELSEHQVESNMFNAKLEQIVARLFATQRSTSAIFCADDTLALSVMLSLDRLGISVPDQVSIVGFTDSRQASQSIPKLTSVRSPAVDLGIAAMQNVHRRILAKNHTGAGPIRHLMIAPQLIVRDSTAIPAFKSSMTKVASDTTSY